jgi:hypothetical protein
MSDLLDDIIDRQAITRRRGAHRGHRRIRFQVHVFRQRRVCYIHLLRCRPGALDGDVIRRQGWPLRGRRAGESFRRRRAVRTIAGVPARLSGDRDGLRLVDPLRRDNIAVRAGPASMDRADAIAPCHADRHRAACRKIAFRAFSVGHCHGATSIATCVHAKKASGSRNGDASIAVAEVFGKTNRRGIMAPNATRSENDSFGDAVPMFCDCRLELLLQVGSRLCRKFHI